MDTHEKNVRYPQNIYLKGLIALSPYTITELADKLEVSRHVLNQTVNGHYKGGNIVPRVLEAFGADFLDLYKELIPKN